LLNKRRWQIQAVTPGPGRSLDLAVIGTSAAAQGMTRHLPALLYGRSLFIEQRGPRYWHSHLDHDWQEDEWGPVLHCHPASDLDLLSAHSQQPAQAGPANDFSWSYSRANLYRRCPRAYYYHYYAAWEGWAETAPAPVKRVYLLKNLTDLPRWRGTLVHETIKFALARLKAGQPVAPADLIKQMRVRAEADFGDSQSGRYRQQPNQRTGFQEHYYRTMLSPPAWSTAWAQAEREVTTFLNSSLYGQLKQNPATLLEVDALPSFEVAGEKVWVQFDLARLEPETLYIYDWKTGPVEDEAALRRQLGIYGLYFRMSRPDVAANRILRGVVYALAEDRLIDFIVDEALLRQTEQQIKASLRQLRGLLLDPATNLASIEPFPMIDDLPRCAICQFRELCGRAGGQGS
jgi:hypothetical protein